MAILRITTPQLPECNSAVVNVICKTCAVKNVLLVIVTVDLHSSFTFLLSKVHLCPDVKETGRVAP